MDEGPWPAKQTVHHPELALLYQEFYTDEYGVGFPPSRVIAFMNPLFNYLETAQDPNLGYPADNNRLVQQWLWFRHACT